MANHHSLLLKTSALAKVLLGLILILGLTVGTPEAVGQELFFRVRVVGSNVQGVDSRVFAELERAATEFLNLRRRTTDEFKPNERILGNLSLTITAAPRIGAFRATAQVQAIRPVYGAALETPMLNFPDRDWEFEYSEGTPLDFNENTLQYYSSLTSLLSYYAYLVIGLDYDSFSKLGGTTYLQKAQNICTNTESADQGKGWKTFDGVNTRRALIDNLLDQRVQPFRESLYVYHRKALDEFQQDPEAARARVTQCLKDIQKAAQAKPMNNAINTWLDTKASEIVNLYSQGQPTEKQAAYQVLVQIDPTKTEKYQTLIR